jgi:simple sugar transport system substrate-binding protein
MKRRLPTLAALALTALAAGCGDTKTVREGPVTVQGGAATDVAGAAGAASPGGGVRIFVVTHGQASSPFWAIVRTGVDAAARQMEALVTYRAADVYSVERMTAFIDQAVAAKPDGLVVSVPEPALAPAIERATRAGIPVVTINSGSDMYRKLGALAHIGQPEDRAGFRAGQRLATSGVRRALCVNLKIPNQGLDRRCAGLASAMRRAGGHATVVRIDDQDPGAPQQIAKAVAAGRIDGVLTLNATSGLAAVQGLSGKKVTIGTFDLGPDVLKAVQDGRLAFAVDQQPYLQGYLPVVFLAELARHGLFPAQGDVIPTGPNFVTRANAAKAIELAKRSIR